MFPYKFSNCVKFSAVESASPLQGKRIQPQFRNHVLTSHVNMWRFTAIKRDKEKTIRSYSENSRHLPPPNSTAGWTTQPLFCERIEMAAISAAMTLWREPPHVSAQTSKTMYAFEPHG